MLRAGLASAVVVTACGTTSSSGPPSPEQSTPPQDGGIYDTGTDVALADHDAADAADAADALPPDGGGRLVDPSTLTHKLIMGYQGWFFCPGDGAPMNTWVHWFRGAPYDATTLTVDMYPSVSELDPDERCATSFTFPNGQPAPLYSAWNTKTVERHFAWMRDHDLDGVFLERFLVGVANPALKPGLDQVLRNVMSGAEKYGRTFAVEYDISGQDPTTLVDLLKADWEYLVDTIGVTKSPSYLNHAGKPVLEVWGFGVAGRPGTPQQATDTIAWLRSGAPTPQQATLVGGVARDWRTDATWGPIVRGFDIINPWTVGAYVDDASADVYAATVAADLAEAKANGREFMPVVFPGFSWKNLNNGPLNQIPRRAGKFYWRQVYNAVAAGSPMIFGAMFDEVDEGTAMYKIAPSAADMPAQGSFVALDADGTTLPDDWYLRIANEAGKMLRGETPLSSTLPITPP
jgi:hypothetical protein